MNECDRIDLFLLPTDALTPHDEERLGASLNHEERARAERMRVPEARLGYVAAHALCRFALSARTPGRSPAQWEFVADGRGKPEIRPGSADGLTFNLSHTDGMCAVAVARQRPVGVDVEGTGKVPLTEALAATFCTETELQMLRSVPDLDRRHRHILELWTLKESLLKAVGTGFLASPHSIEFGLQPLSLRLLSTGLGGPWKVWKLSFGGHHVAVSSGAEGAPILRACRVTATGTDFHAVPIPCGADTCVSL